MAAGQLLSSPAKQDLMAAFVGKSLRDESIAAPAAILDLAKIRKNCNDMQEACQELQLSFRAHIKTHKTVELTRLQIGEGSKDVRLIVSTIAEAEFVLPLLKEYQSNGAKVDVLYGVPLGSSHVPRLSSLAANLGPDVVSAIIDNPDQLSSLKSFKARAGFALRVFIKADSGYHRAGLPPNCQRMANLVNAIHQLEGQDEASFLGFYSHNSLSYNGVSPSDAMDMLKVEIDTCRQATKHLPGLAQRQRALVVSVGASPTALSIQNLLKSRPGPDATPSPSAKALREILQLKTLPSSELTSAASSIGFELEVHAGVYTTFDIQQVAASSRSYSSIVAAHEPIALSVLAEVISTYPDRTSSPEALINAGCLSLAREPCKDYCGWGVVSPWNMESGDPNIGEYTEECATDPKRRIVVKRVSQEHGIMGWEDDGNTTVLPLRYGQKLRLWPNHACITSACFDWYLVVDSEDESTKGEVVVDVWPRVRGW